MASSHNFRMCLTSSHIKNILIMFRVTVQQDIDQTENVFQPTTHETRSIKAVLGFRGRYKKKIRK